MGSARPFHCQQFTIYQDRCAMKVGTDSLLLGSWVEPSGGQTVLDIGTGTGLLALMMGQRIPNAAIRAIEIDGEAAGQARENVAASPWPDRIQVDHTSLQAFVFHTGLSYELVICNPPFFESGHGVKSINEQRQLARHADHLSHETLLTCVAQLLSETGRFAVVIPFAQEGRFLELAARIGLYPIRYTAVRPFPNREPNRLMLELARVDSRCDKDHLFIRDAMREYSARYRQLTAPFYLSRDKGA